MAKKVKPQIELTIDSIGFKGIGIGRVEGLVHFVKFGVPGDRLIVQLHNSKKKHTEAEIIQIVSPSDHRVHPICDYFGVCGGCSWQNMDYNTQLAWKKQTVIDSFERIGNLKDIEIDSIMPSPRYFNYRNKMEFTFGAERWLTKSEISSLDTIFDKEFALGLHLPGRYDRILDIEKCHIHEDVSNRVLEIFRSKAKLLSVKPYNSKTDSGFLKNLVIRSNKLGNIMLILVTNKIIDESDNLYLEWFSKVHEIIPEATTTIWALNDNRSPMAKGKEHIIHGEGLIYEQILDIQFRISPFSFFQTNSYQLDSFISEIIKSAELNSDMIAWDLYCGTGSITLPASKYLKSIYGFELVQSSIDDAKINMQLNGIKNCVFEVLDLHKIQSIEYLRKFEQPDVIFIDPPRAGMEKNLINLLLEIKSQRIIYVSCNPTTQARDCALLSDSYSIDRVVPVDMFPQTYHVESIATLTLKD